MENILLEFPYNKHEHIALVRLNRPKVLNALSTDLMQELVDCFLSLDKNPEVRVIILTGNDRAFAAGADIARSRPAGVSGASGSDACSTSTPITECDSGRS